MQMQQEAVGTQCARFKNIEQVSNKPATTSTRETQVCECT